tara:strand:+ start:76755 stop:77420 length:666 start_codon:yes stop_codon:yes gene_type:complete
MNNDELVKKALADIEYLRSAFDETVSSPEKRKTLKLEFIINALAFMAALALWSLNRIDPQILDKAFEGSRLDHELATMTIGITFSILVLGSVSLYAIIWKAARNSELRFSDFINRNFHYLMAQSFLSDLIIKFATISLVISYKHSELVSPLLCLFTLDYIWQGRLFHFGKPIRIVFGTVGLLIGGLVFWNSNLTISDALSFFIVVSFFSNINLLNSLAKVR